MATTAAPKITERALLDALEHLPAQQSAAVRVLHVVDDPASSSTDLATAVGADPVLTAQVMRMANSAYYGLSGRVRSCEFAVTLLGFATIRSLAAAFAAGAIGAEPAQPGQGFRRGLGADGLVAVQAHPLAGVGLDGRKGEGE